MREWKRDRAHQQQQTDSESDSDDENECSRNDALADGGWVETIRDKNYGGGKASKQHDNLHNKSEFMNKSSKEAAMSGDLNKEFRQMNIGSDNSGSGSDLLMGGDKMSQSGNFKLQQNVSTPLFF